MEGDRMLNSYNYDEDIRQWEEKNGKRVFAKQFDIENYMDCSIMKNEH